MQQYQMAQLFQGSIQFFEGNLGSLVLQYSIIQQNYLNQLRVLIELKSISDEQLKLNNFDRSKYKKLVMEKIKVLQELSPPKKISQQKLNTEVFREAFEKLEKLQRQIKPFENKFDQSYIQSLQSFSKQSLLNIQQELYSQSLMAQINQLDQLYAKLQNETKEMAKISSNNRKILRQLQIKQAEVKVKKQKYIKMQKQNEIKRQFLAVQSQKSINKANQLSLEGKKSLKQKEEIQKKMKQLKSDDQVSKIKQIFDNLKDQRTKEEEICFILSERYQKQSIDQKRNLIKEVYMGDIQKMTNCARIMKLEEKLESLMKQWHQRRQGRAKDKEAKKRFGSRIIQIGHIGQ